ncbi:hypothetical protein HD806DRAFT_251106 [Xylariaceae sp. AK1471]|nr:hypothetical protein HD806DRAFT_251106 [Xylariaceae sp. AK1471]
MTATLPTLPYNPTRHPGCCLSLSRPLLFTINSLLTSSIPGTPFSDPDPEPEPGLVLSIGSGTGLLEELLHTYLTTHVTHDTQLLREGDRDNRCWRWRVEGVEVNSNVNVYLPEDRINHVPGTWAVLEKKRTRARDAVVLLFVYPRDGALVRRYIDEFMTTSTKGSAIESKSARGGESEGDDEVNAKRKTNSRDAKDDDGDDTSTSRNNSSSRKGEVQLIIWLGPKADWEDTGLGAIDVSDEFEILEMPDGVGLAEYEMLAALRRKKAATLEQKQRV